MKKGIEMSNAKNPEGMNPASIDERIELETETDENEPGHSAVDGDDQLFEEMISQHQGWEETFEESTNPMFLRSSSRILGRHDLPNWE